MDQDTSLVKPDKRSDARPAEHPVTLRQSGRALLFVGLYLAGFVGVMIAAAMLGFVGAEAGPFVTTFLVGTTAVIYLALYLHLFRRNRLTLEQVGFRRPTRRMFHLIWQIPASILAALTLQILFLAALAPLGVDTAGAGAANGPLADLPGLSPTLVVVAFLVIAVLTPIWEEVLFRGAFLSGFSRRFRPWVAVVLSAALFAVLHLALINFAGLFTLGIALALLHRFHRNLWAPILLHAVNNAFVMLVVFALL
jgi:hypothetical protein